MHFIREFSPKRTRRVIFAGTPVNCYSGYHRLVFRMKQKIVGFGNKCIVYSISGAQALFLPVLSRENVTAV
jgi:hypothetical protein